MSFSMQACLNNGELDDVYLFRRRRTESPPGEIRIWARWSNGVTIAMSVEDAEFLAGVLATAVARARSLAPDDGIEMVDILSNRSAVEPPAGSTT